MYQTLRYNVDKSWKLMAEALNINITAMFGLLPFIKKRAKLKIVRQMQEVS